jgi:transcriptional regulator with XRE-family HTH domain
MLPMAKLEDRLREVMQAHGWEHADVVRISGQSSSVVSQWLGGGNKEIKRIARVGAAVRLAEASGFRAEWIAEGTGPKRSRLASIDVQHPTVAHEPMGAYTTTALLDQLEQLLQSVPHEQREAVATNLAGWAREGGQPHWRPALATLLDPSAQRSKRVA